MPSKAAQRAYYERNRQQVIDKAKEWHTANPERSRAIKRKHAAKVGNRDRMLRSRYGITEADYDEMLVAQGGVCAICKGTQATTLPVDHCHESGRVRGILCSACNRMLGDAQDNIEVLQAAIRYLQPGAPTGAKEA